ncbi:unnamed protein product [Rotaria sp. Silwood2]|nr:unnamed protein product [Rotaria sp. Silwood2]CAF4226586.1 unnamed protein product [Rotaria sp. Silwood2]
MLSDVNNFESHDYVVSQDKIGYIEQDNIVYNVVYGYKTLFAYHCKHEKGKISKESLHENISIRINSCSFSYAEIPLQFAYIMDVTGTLETLKLVVHLTEDASLEEKEKLIKRATSSNQITLFARTYGRGTDFICHDPIVAANSGTHVIQTFFSEEFSEEKQIKGRTARQDDQGSYSMILFDRDLEKFHIEKVQIEDIKKGKGFLTRITDTVTDALRFTKTYEIILIRLKKI